jgi:ABC-type polysaccharide/polyol phosphate export permease
LSITPARSDEPPEDAPGPVRRLLQRRETLWFLVLSNLRAGHRDKLLGNFWNLLDPLLFMGVYFLVFGIGFRQAQGSPREFVIYLAIGVIVWRFFEGSASEATSCIRARRGLVHEIDFPKALLPISICLSRLYDFCWALLVAGLVALGLGVDLTPSIVWLLPTVLLQVLFTAGFSLVVAHLGAFYADTTNVVRIGMRLWFFSSPVFYFARDEAGRSGIIPEEYLSYYMLNPLARFMDAYRDALLWGRAPGADTLLYLAAVSCVTFLLGFVLFARADRSFAKYI